MKIKGLSSLELHELADKHNFDDGAKKLKRIIESPNCDVLTAQMIYWMSAPDYYYDKYGGAMFCTDEHDDFAGLIVAMEKKARIVGYKEDTGVVLSKDMIEYIEKSQLDYTVPPYNRIPECFRRENKLKREHIKEEFLKLTEAKRKKHLEKLHKKGENKQIIDIMISLGKENLSADYLSILARAYNNNRDMIMGMKTLDLIPEESRDAKWYYRYGYAYLGTSQYNEGNILKAIEVFEKAAEKGDKEVAEDCAELIFYSIKGKDVLKKNKEKFPLIFEAYSKKYIK